MNVTSIVIMLWSDCVPPPNSYVDILIPKGDGISRWGLWEVIRS